VAAMRTAIMATAADLAERDPAITSLL
jgi:hypothetical protein